MEGHAEKNKIFVILFLIALDRFYWYYWNFCNFHLLYHTFSILSDTFLYSFLLSLLLALNSIQYLLLLAHAFSYFLLLYNTYSYFLIQSHTFSYFPILSQTISTSQKRSFDASSKIGSFGLERTYLDRRRYTQIPKWVEALAQKS